MILPAPAKINLFLHITKRRSDGMHQLQTIFQLLDYSDTLIFSKRDDNIINVECDKDIDTKINTVYRSAVLLQQRCANSSLGVDIKIKKHIPLGAGLGGGSSDAATTLCGLNCLWQTDVSKNELCNIGLQIGADVPFFINGHSAWGEGVGEKLTNIELDTHYIAVFTPDIHISTSEMFAMDGLKRDCIPITYQEYCEDKSQAVNVFEPLIRSRYSEVDRVMHSLVNDYDVFLSGTGSAFFVMFNDKQKAQALLNQYAQQIDGFVVKSVNQSPLHQTLELNTN